jgi:hypothetical protein
MRSEWVDLLRDLVEAAQQYGPFFFSIWFLYAFAKWSYKNYAAIATLEGRTDQERQNHWLYFVSSTIFGCVLVVVCTVWWIMNRPQMYIFTGEIDNVDTDSSISSPEVYVREWIGEDSEKEIYFVAISPQPFEKGQKFRLHIKHAHGNFNQKRDAPPAALVYDGRSNRKFLMAIDQVVPIDDLKSK